MNMKKWIMALLILTVAWQGRAATADDTAAQQPDSMELHASLLVISPGNDFYTTLGHCAIRLQAFLPADTLDYSYTLEMDAQNKALDYLLFMAGRKHSHWAAIPTDTFLINYANEHRQVTAYELPCRHKEIQQLWERLDDAYVSPDMLPFDLSNNCTQGVVEMICQGNPPSMTIAETCEMASMNNGELIRTLSEKYPWMQFLAICLIGNEADKHWPVTKRMIPSLLPKMLRYHLSSLGQEEPVEQTLEHAPTTIIMKGTEPSPASRLTPGLVFSLLLVLLLLMLVLNMLRRCRRLTCVFDLLLFSAQLLLFLLMVWLTQLSTVFVRTWNWYLLPLFPLPLLLFLFGKKKNFGAAKSAKAFSVYTLLLLLFILATPLSNQLDLTHQLITATVAVRSFAHSSFFFGRRKS